MTLRINLYLKNSLVNTDLSGKIIGFGEPKAITLPYTAEYDGILHVDMTSSDANQGFLYVQVGSRVIALLSSGGYMTSGSGPVKKGEFITIANSGHYKEYHIYFLPYIYS